MLSNVCAMRLSGRRMELSPGAFERLKPEVANSVDGDGNRVRRLVVKHDRDR